MTDTAPELRYVRDTPAGADYVSQISARESDRRARATFRDLVGRLAAPGAKLFDFGSGPGIDARFFAERGFTVDTYDVDPRMREFCAEHCRDFIDSGRITLQAGTYREFLARQTPAGAVLADLVISNFAPLNLIDDLGELFGKFQTLTGPAGRVFASVLNPCFLGELRSHRWWRDAPRLWRAGELFLPGPQAPHYRRRIHNFRKVCGPHFRLSRIFSARDDGMTWLHIARSRYLFLLFEKTGGQCR